MRESDAKQLASFKEAFDVGISEKGESLNPDKKAQLAIQIAQLEFIFNGQSSQGKKYLEKALNYPPALGKTYPIISDRTKIVAMASYAVLESMHSGIFAPSGDDAGIMIIDVQRYADRLEKKPSLSIMEFKDLLFMRFVSAVFGATAFINKERRDKVVNDLQRTISSLPERFPNAAEEIAERENLQELIRLFNQTKWNSISVLEGQPVVLLDAAFRSYQGLPPRTPRQA